MGRPGRSGKPLHDAVVRGASHANLAGAPGLLGDPLDRVVDVVTFLRRPIGGISLGHVDATGIGHNDGITRWTPCGGVLRLNGRIVAHLRVIGKLRAHLGGPGGSACHKHSTK